MGKSENGGGPGGSGAPGGERSAGGSAEQGRERSPGGGAEQGGCLTGQLTSSSGWKEVSEPLECLGGQLSAERAAAPRPRQQRPWRVFEDKSEYW